MVVRGAPNKTFTSSDKSYFTGAHVRAFKPAGSGTLKGTFSL